MSTTTAHRYDRHGNCTRCDLYEGDAIRHPDCTPLRTTTLRVLLGELVELARAACSSSRDDAARAALEMLDCAERGDYGDVYRAASMDVSRRTLTLLEDKSDPATLRALCLADDARQGLVSLRARHSGHGIMHAVVTGLRVRVRCLTSRDEGPETACEVYA